MSVLPSTLSLVSNTGCLAQSSCSINLLNECSVAKVEGSEGSESHSGVSNSLRPHGLYRVRNSPGQNTGVGSLSLLQGIFPTQGSNPGLPHCRQILYQLSHQGSPRILEWVPIPSPADLQDPGIEPGSPALQILYQLSYQKSPKDF